MCTETVMWKENGSKVHFEGVFWGYKWAIAGSAAGAVTQPPAWFCPIHDTEACHSLPSLEGSSYWKCHRLFWFVCGTVCLCNVKHLHTLVFNRTPHGFFMHYFGRLCLNYPVHSGWPKENVVTLVIIKNKIKKNNVCVKDSLITFKTPINLPFTFFFPTDAYCLRIPEFERRSAVAGGLAEMAASEHQGHFMTYRDRGALTSQTSLPSLRAQTREIRRNETVLSSK